MQGLRRELLGTKGEGGREGRDSDDAMLCTEAVFGPGTHGRTSHWPAGSKEAWLP